MSIGAIIALTAWGVLAILSTMSYIQYFNDLTIIDKVMYLLIMTIGAPIFTINNILVMMLDAMLPEGWDNDGFN